MTAPSRTPTARFIALLLLTDLLEHGKPDYDHPALLSLRTPDRAFVRHLVATSLRRLGQIDSVLDHCLKKPLPLKARHIRNILRLGACQLLFMKTPSHAAVQETVALVALPGFRPFVNAVLRRIAAEGPKLLTATDIADNCPAWLRMRWMRHYGASATEAILAAHVKEPPLDFTTAGDPHLWMEPLVADLLPTGSLRRKKAGLIEHLPGYAEGAWWVQDIAASLPVKVMGSLSGKKVLDLCAAPGGKTAQLSAMGAQVTAVDESPDRVKRMQGNMQRLRLKANLVAADVLQFRPPFPPDAILLDAPCSATGTIRRHPDLPWRRKPEDIASLARLQRSLLKAALTMLPPGGLLVYSTCSLEPEEGEQQIAHCLAADDALSIDPLRAEEWPDFAAAIDRDGALRTLPSHWAQKGGMDGFYICRLRRR